MVSSSGGLNMDKIAYREEVYLIVTLRFVAWFKVLQILENILLV
jgi:hypothetical protein